jgi:hypothetical protein
MIRPLLLGALLILTGGRGLAQESPATPENIEAAYKISLAAAAEYEFRVGDDNAKPLDLVREPRLKWSNPAVSDVQGNVFVWTCEGQPLVVGSFTQWFSRPAIQHEFHSLAEAPLRARFHGEAVWATEQAGLTFADVPGATVPAAGETQRGLQLKKLAREFTANARYRNAPDDTELRLLPQPVHTYSAGKEGVLSGGLFAFVRGTDPEIFLAIEARGKDASTARWRFAAARMTNMAVLRLSHRGKPVWERDLRPWAEVSGSHELPYTAFAFDRIPEFLKDDDRPKP